MTIKLRSTRAMAWAAAFGLVLLLCAGQALALGLGRIEVKSRAGEPLLAEIQVISSDPAELDALSARLASPDTFRRIGLPAPDAVLSGLEFSVALDVRGNPVIRVTTREPVTQPMLTFLVEVDWGQGRLVREYSALVDAPQTVAAPAQPAIEAPSAAPSGTIVRPPGPVAGEALAQEPGAAEGGAPAEAGDAGANAAAGDDAPAEAVAAAPVPAPAPPPARPGPEGEYGPVQAGETLGEIAQRLVGDGIRREQAVVALFRANPEAFIANNLNLVRQGAVLRIPDRSEIAVLDLAESRALMREQIAAWREMIEPAPLPEAAASREAGAAVAGDGSGGRAGGPRVADARLEIVPPAAGEGREAGVRSGIQAGGEGEMLRQELHQELQQNQETLAAREAEVAELKARVADLERLQSQQAQLIELKDSELAAVQERLANAPAAQAGDAAGLPWAWIGAGLLLVGLLAWLLLRRSPRSTPRPRFDAATLAAATSASGPSTPAAKPPVPEAPPAARTAPTWHADGAPEAASLPSGQSPGAAHREALEAVDAAVIASLNPAPGGVERIELARAYIDLGDVETARDLLREVADAGDPAARAEATRILDGIA